MIELEPQHQQLEAFHDGDWKYRMAMELIASNNLTADTAVKCWDSLPRLNYCSSEEQNAVLARIHSANMMLPRVENLIYKDIQKKASEGVNVDLDEYLSSKTYPESLSFSQREYQIAASQAIFKLFARNLSNSPEPEEERDFGPLKYFGTVHDYLVGAITADFEFVASAYGGRVDLQLVEKTAITIIFSDKKKLVSAQLERLQKGDSVTLLRKTENGTYSIITSNPNSSPKKKEF